MTARDVHLELVEAYPGCTRVQRVEPVGLIRQLPGDARWPDEPQYALVELVPGEEGRFVGEPGTWEECTAAARERWCSSP